MTVVVIGVDPGESTGVATLVDARLMHAWQGSAKDALTLIELTIVRYIAADVTIACERFVSMRRQRGQTHQPTAQRVSGAVEYLARHHGCRFVQQGPADAWAMAPNDILFALGVYQRGSDVGQADGSDANMAIRHALLYLSHAHATLFDELLRRHRIDT